MPVAAFSCDGCGVTLRTSDPNPAGKLIKCPTCTTVFHVPADYQAQAAAQPTVTDVTCVDCGAVLHSAAPLRVGQMVQCTKCTTIFRIPEPVARAADTGSAAPEYFDVWQPKDIDHAGWKALDPPPSPYACKEAPERASGVNPWDKLPAEYQTTEPRPKRRKSRAKGAGLWVPVIASASVALCVALIITLVILSRSHNRSQPPVAVNERVPAKESPATVEGLNEPAPVSGEDLDVPVVPPTTQKVPRAFGAQTENDGEQVDSAAPPLIPPPPSLAPAEPPGETSGPRSLPERRETRRHDLDPLPWTPPDIPRVYARTAREGDSLPPRSGPSDSGTAGLGQPRPQAPRPVFRPSPETNPSADAPQLPGDMGGAAVGSGFVVASGGYIIAPWHVVNGADQVLVLSTKVNKQLAAKVVEHDEERDLALLQLKQNVTLRPLGPAGDRDASPGHQVAVIGFSLASGQMKVVPGTVSAVPDADNGRMLVFAAPIDAGHSGAPLCDSFGNVIGMVAAKSPSNDPVGTAVPASDLTAFLQKHIKTFKVSAPYTKRKSWEEVDRIAGGSVVLVVKPK